MKKLLIWLMLAAFLVQTGLSFSILEDMDTLPNSFYWTQVTNNASDCNITIDDGALLFERHNNLTDCYMKFNFGFNGSDDIEVLASVKSVTYCGQSVGGFSFGDIIDPDAGNIGDYQDEGVDYINIHRQNTNPPKYIQFHYIGQGGGLVGAGLFDLYPTVWYNYSLIYYKDTTIQKTWNEMRGQNVGTGLNLIANVSNIYTTNKTNLTFSMGLKRDGSGGGCDDQRIKFDNVYLSGHSPLLDELATCTDPCIVNETFSYDDSICLHGWSVGDCNDLNEPIYESYLCSDSSQIIARYFPIVTKNDGIIEFGYELMAQDDGIADYEILFGFASTPFEMATGWYYDGGTIYDLRDNVNLTTYSLDSNYIYKIRLNLNTGTYDFYQDNILKAENIQFVNKVDNINAFFIQPDYNRGYPYCYYTLDNIYLKKSIAIIPGTNTSNMLGDYFSLDPDNPGFDSGRACKSGENLQICFFRANFESLMKYFTNFVFNNFLLFLMFLVIVLFVILLKRHRND